MMYHVKWAVPELGRTASGPTPHDTAQSAFGYADIVVEILTAMRVTGAGSQVWVEDQHGNRVSSPSGATVS